MFYPCSSVAYLLFRKNASPEYRLILGIRLWETTFITYDGLHPNDAGYEASLPLAQKAIDSVLK